MGRRGLWAVVFGGAVAIAMATSAAWACTEQAYLTTVGSTSGVAGAPVTVKASYFNEAQVDIRWANASGPVVATGQGPSFETTFNVPPGTTGGVHYIVATQAGSPNPATPFKVTVATPPPAVVAPDPPSSSQPAVSAPAASTPQGPAAAEPSSATAQQPETSAGTSATPSAPASSVAGRAPVNPAARPSPAQAVPARTSSPIAAAEGVAAAPFQPSPAVEATAAPEASAPAPSARTITDDLGSGFTAAEDGRAAPSLLTPLATGDRTSSVPALAAVLLTVGLAGLSLAFGVAGVQRRRRSPATTS